MKPSTQKLVARVIAVIMVGSMLLGLGAQLFVSY